MKVVLFCGGTGMRLRGYVDDVPKPMVQIGTRPILWHLMKYYAHFGHTDFILCLGYKVNVGAEGMVREICALSRSDIWINGGFFVMRQEIFRYIQPGEELVREPFQRLMQQRALLAYKCTGFWQCMDTFKDKQRLEELNQSIAPWQVWNHVANSISNHSVAI